ncbi:asparaginyl-tRNA synthetase [Morchella conica CCBAS932]|uniref:asparagine--tRNA ligase n=1 Tax=Morchella conica CCBAS932 TaxID=1392247 RepID=A0A3N4LAZ9_9PEZI|nr:asparaginyl-tRNA synthetase [Morchella conica CCBAS932]
MAPPVVTVHGWIRSVRRMKNVSFAHIADGSTTVPLQAVLTKEQSEGLATGASVKITGEWKKSISGGKQAKELLAQEVKIIGEADPETYPLQKKYQTAEYLRSLPHLRSRIPGNSNLLQLRSYMISRLTAFFSSHEFVQCHPPIITSSDAEGAGEVFTVSSNAAATNENKAAHFFRDPKYLTVSSQLHLEALAAALPRVWTLSPTFRAEKSDTARHLSEFYMLEVETSFIDSLEPLLNTVEDMAKDLVRGISNSRVGAETLSSAGEKAGEIEERWKGLLENEWSRITYTEAVDGLQAAVNRGEVKFVFPPTWGVGLQAEHEKFLAQTLGGGGKGGPVFVTDYPRDLKPFYMLPSRGETQEGRETVACFDLLLPVVGELVGGSLREHRYEELVGAMKKMDLVPEDEDELGNLRWYAELRKWGSTEHGGFGMGFDRLLCYLAGVDNIRETVTFPRWVGRCDC